MVGAQALLPKPRRKQSGCHGQTQAGDALQVERAEHAASFVELLMGQGIQQRMVIGSVLGESYQVGLRARVDARESRKHRPI